MLPSHELKSTALELGFTTVGICAAEKPRHYEAYESWISKGCHGEMGYLARHAKLREHSKNLLPSAKSIIATTLNYNQPNPAIQGKPRIARYALGRDYHKVMRAKLQKLAKWVKENHPGSECRPCVDSAPILERDFAQLAGLGWFGKNTCLIDSRRGSWFFIGLLLSSVDFEPDRPATGGCGKCRKCIDACPTGAIVHEEGRWQVDARKCISYLTIEHRSEIPPELANKIGDWTFGCDICQEVCPFNEPRESQPLRGATTEEEDFLRLREWPNLQALAQISEDKWDDLTTGSPVRRAGHKGLIRNAENNSAREQRCGNLECGDHSPL